MVANMIELHFLVDSSLVSVNVNHITDFYGNEHGSAICFGDGYRINVMESYELVKQEIFNSLKEEN